jgi:isopentenyl diphosphate isomerase/L-lactate dehydrogenase-like FMN-dependent dehydrogenase
MITKTQTLAAVESRHALMILSPASNYSMEDVRKAAPRANLWLNVYMFESRSKTEELIRRAEKANFGAIVVSMDMQCLSSRRYAPIDELLKL